MTQQNLLVLFIFLRLFVFQVKHRKGFIKLALKHGWVEPNERAELVLLFVLLLMFVFVRRAQLVPVFSFGENELFDQMENPAGSPLRRLQVRGHQTQNQNQNRVGAVRWSGSPR